MPTTPGRRRGERGSSTIEFVIGVTVMVLLLMMVVQGAMYFHQRSVASTAARQGVDRGRVLDATGADAAAAANEFLDQSGGALEDRKVRANRGPNEVTVRVTGGVMSVMPGVHLDVDVTVAAPVEEFTP